MDNAAGGRVNNFGLFFTVVELKDDAIELLWYE